jgi:hypothetical protein
MTPRRSSAKSGAVNEVNMVSPMAPRFANDERSERLALESVSTGMPRQRPSINIAAARLFLMIHAVPQKLWACSRLLVFGCCAANAREPKGTSMSLRSCVSAS